jgi:hypothetical protein
MAYRNSLVSTSQHGLSVTEQETPVTQAEITVSSAATTTSTAATITVNLRTLPAQHRSCCLCGKGAPLHVMPKSARLQTLSQTQVYIPDGNRCCQDHLLSSIWLKWSDLQYVKSIRDQLPMQPLSVTEDVFLALLQTTEKMAASRATLDFDDDTVLGEEEYKALTGLSKHHFTQLTQVASEGGLESTRIMPVRRALALFLMKLRTGEPNAILASLFNLKMPRQVGRVIQRVVVALKRSFVPYHLGINHLTREQAITHIPDYCRVLMPSAPESVTVIVDGTYSYIQKPGDNSCQRKRFCMHKNRHLVKPTMFALPDSYILLCLPHYLSDSKNNDAAILEHALRNDNELRQWFHRDDVFVVDRGYSDSKTYLEEQGFVFKMPTFLPKGDKQLATCDANANRCITRVRFVVEIINRRWREWRFFQGVIHNRNYEHLDDYTQIACALINAFSVRIVSNDDYRLAVAQTIRDKQLTQQINHLQQDVVRRGLNRASRAFIECNPDTELLDFPQLSLEIIKSSITLGDFQIKQARWYISEALNTHGSYKISYHKEENGLLRARIQSRHISAKCYFVWIRYDTESVHEWYCQCKAGARTVGCCSHVASVICYLGFYRYHRDKIPTTRSTMQFKDAADRQ